MPRLFSKRSKSYPTELRYDIPQDVRTRILVVFENNCHETNGGFVELLNNVGRKLIKEYGYIHQSAFRAARRSDNPIIEHFYLCEEEKALDFVELCFQQFNYSGGQEGVDEINEIFRETGSGYELTPYIERKVKKENARFGRAGTIIEHEYPTIILKKNTFIHEEVIAPALQLLSDARFHVANKEFLKAHSAIRIGDSEDAITLTCSTFESFLKTIIELKGWTYDPQHATCSKLINICRDNGLFPAFYAPVFEAIGTIRNKIGDAHGRGPTKPHDAKQENADHMVQMVSTHMLFLYKLAGIK